MRVYNEHTTAGHETLGISPLDEPDKLPRRVEIRMPETHATALLKLLCHATVSDAVDELGIVGQIGDIARLLSEADC